MGKGGDFERDVSKMFTKWLTGKVKPYKYWRMPGSGGLATIHEECSNLSGDIRSLAIDADFLTDTFSIECKNGYPKSSFWQTFKDIKNFELKKFWIQCCGDAAKSDRYPLLIYRKKGNKVIVGIQDSVARDLEELAPDLKELSHISVFFDQSLPPVTFYDFCEFLNIITPDVVKKFKG